jgi:hypothetical protein
MCRTVLAASATAALVASAKLVGEVPTSSVILYIPGITFLLGEFALPVAMHFNPKGRQEGVASWRAGGAARHSRNAKFRIRNLRPEFAEKQAMLDSFHGAS